MGTRPGIGLLLASILSAAVSLHASAFTFPGSIPNGLEAAGSATATATGVPASGLDNEDSGVLSTAPAHVALSAGASGAVSGSITADLTAKYGVLTMSGNGSVQLNTLSFPSLNISTAALGLLNSLPNVAYQDTLTITSPTLPAGTPVSVQFTNKTTATISIGGATFGQNAVTSSFQANLVTGGGNVAEPELLFKTPSGSTSGSSDVRSQVLDLHVGDTLLIGGYLDTNVGAGTGTSSFTVGASQILDIDVLTTGVGYTSASGTQYAIAAPEPASALFAAIMLPVALRGRRRG